MKINYKKALKLSTLLLTSIVIATVSAQSYRYLYMSGSVSIAESGLKWVKGDEAGAMISIAGSTVTTSLALTNGTNQQINNILYIKNLDASAHDITVDVTHAATPSYYVANGFNVTLRNNSTSALVDTLNALTTDTYSGTIDASGVWHVVFEVYTLPDSTGNSDDFNMQFRYE